MAAEDAKHDQNGIFVAMAVTDDANLEPRQLRVDPTTKRLEVDILFV